MSDDIFLINEAEETQLSASQVFKKTVGLTMKDEELSIVFSTIQNKKGYGKQYIPVDQLEPVLAVLKDAVDNGIHKDSEKSVKVIAGKFKNVEGPIKKHNVVIILME